MAEKRLSSKSSFSLI